MMVGGIGLRYAQIAAAAENRGCCPDFEIQFNADSQISLPMLVVLKR